MSIEFTMVLCVTNFFLSHSTLQLAYYYTTSGRIITVFSYNIKWNRQIPGRHVCILPDIYRFIEQIGITNPA